MQWFFNVLFVLTQMSEVPMAISYAVDILMIMVEFDVTLVKDHIVQQQQQVSSQDDVSVIMQSLFTLLDIM